MNRFYLVVLDPGHGGADPGAQNEGLKLRECDINLQVAKAIDRVVMNGDYLFRTYLVRDRDVFLSLETRCRVANERDTDAFISIHCNATEDKSASGFEVWTSIGKTPADSLATEIFMAFKTAFPHHNARADWDDGDPDKETNFYVLRNTKAPAVLVEMEFISNDEQAAFLANPDNQTLIAREIADSIEAWLEGGK